MNGKTIALLCAVIALIADPVGAGPVARQYLWV
jgi:hypothetical protein